MVGKVKVYESYCFCLVSQYQKQANKENRKQIKQKRSKMLKLQGNTRKKATCPLCGSFLCSGVIGNGIQILCKGKALDKCNKLIEINFTEKGVETMVITIPEARASPLKFAAKINYN